MKSFVTKAVVEAVVLVASHTLATKTFAAFWKAVSPKLSEGVSYMEKHQDEGLEADRTFLEVITFRDAQIQRIVDDCLKEFMHSDVLRLIDQVQKIQDRVTERREQINAWKLATISAPSTSLMPLKRTRTWLERRIAREKKAIEADNAKIETLKTETLAKLAQDGIVMTPEQIDGLLYTAEGTQLAQVMAVAENIKAIEKQLAELLASPDAGPEQVKSYTGFLMMSYRVYIVAIARAIDVIDDDYLYRISDIINEANNQMLAADEIHQKSPERSAIAINNIDINARTIELAELYADHLRARKERLAVLLKDMKLNFELARNTFRTVKVGAELIDVIKSSEKDLLSIFEFEPPQLDAFYDKEMRREFDALTQKLRQDGAKRKKTAK
ncbi:MAG: hypothetical protein Q4E62_03880 [Sutterellaceae bacterium]|nr:hypothetical protein [Sutterellaceae bacterium]